MSIDRFYPVSDTMTNTPMGMWQIGMVIKLEDHLQNAKNGNLDSESRLVNRIGQLRRNVPVEHLSENLRDVVSKAVAWLKTTGRIVDLTNPDPALWITQRGGAPRWVVPGVLTELTEKDRYADTSLPRSPSPVKYPDPER